MSSSQLFKGIPVLDWIVRSTLGTQNPSISGASGLENQYVVDGANVTNTGYGGLGSYSIIFGSLGNATPYDFIKEIQVKTGGYGAEYGQATGGVVNVVTGFGADVGAPLVEHPLVRKIAFTGSDSTGRAINQAAAAGFKRVSLELGGKSPNIVFADANLDNAVKGVVAGIFAATGQTCIAGSRLLVQEEIHDCQKSSSRPCWR